MLAEKRQTILFLTLLLLPLFLFGCGGGGGAGNGRPHFPSSRDGNLWTHTYGGTGDDSFRSIQTTTDGNYIVAGQTNSSGAGDFDYWVMKIDTRGGTLWAKTYGGSEEDMARFVSEATDGGYFVAGQTKSFGAQGLDVWVLKLDKDGEKVWERRLGGGDQDWASSVTPTSDGGCIIAASTKSYGLGDFDWWIIRLNPDGTTLWSKTFGGSDWDTASYAEQTPDGGFIITGFFFSQPYSNGNADAAIMKLDAAGNQQWTKTYGGAEIDISFTVRQTTDGGFILGGYGAYPPDGYIVKTDSVGVQQWSHLYSGSGQETVSWIEQTADGAYVAVGYTESTGAGSYDAWLFKIDPLNGNVIWTRTFGGEDGDWAFCVRRAVGDDGFILAGETASSGAGGHDGWILRTDAEGLTR